MSKGPVKEAVKRGLKRRLTATQQKGAAYQGALEAVFAVLIGAGLGYWADDYFGSEPLFLLVGVVVGFAAFVLRLLRLGEQVNELSKPTDSGSEGGCDRSGWEDQEQEDR